MLKECKNLISFLDEDGCNLPKRKQVFYLNRHQRQWSIHVEDKEKSKPFNGLEQMDLKRQSLSRIL
jgi:hypothetical protein